MALLLEAINLKHAFSNQDLFQCKQLQIFSGDKIGLIGANGSGKSTLLNILFGSLTPDQGTIRRLSEISYFRQFDNAPMNPDADLLRRYHVIDKVNQAQVSGGEHTRITIAQTINVHTPLIFADEVNVNLDQHGRDLLFNDLRRCTTLLLVSHDRHLLDTLCNRIIAIEEGSILSYHGNYNDYLERKAQEKNEAQFTYSQYIKEHKRLKSSLMLAQQRASAIKSAPSRMGNSEARLHKGEIKTRQKVSHRHATILKHRLEALDPQHPVYEKQLSFDFALRHPLASKWVIQAEHLTFAYPNKPPLFHDANFVIPNGSKTLLYGDNGSGKTTLLKAIIAQKEGVIITPQAKIGIFHQDLSNIQTDKTLLENAMLHSTRSETIVRAILAGMGFSTDDYSKLASELSGGERVKLSLCSIFASQANILILDEPTNYLDLLALETLEQMLRSYPGTVLFVSHDQALAQKVATRILILQDNRLTTHEGNWESYLINK